MTCIYISTSSPAHIRDSLKGIADALSINVTEITQAKIIILPSFEATYINRKSQPFLQEVAKVLFCDVPIVSHEWLIDCGIEFKLLPTDPYDFSADKDKDTVPTPELEQHEKEDDGTAATSSIPDIIYAGSPVLSVVDTDSDPDVPLALAIVHRNKSKSRSPEKMVIRDVYDYESSLSPDPEPRPKPTKRPFPFHILMKGKSAKPRADWNRSIADAKDSEELEMLIELLEERCSQVGPRASGKRLCCALDEEVGGTFSSAGDH